MEENYWRVIWLFALKVGSAITHPLNKISVAASPFHPSSSFAIMYYFDLCFEGNPNERNEKTTYVCIYICVWCVCVSICVYYILFYSTCTFVNFYTLRHLLDDYVQICSRTLGEDKLAYSVVIVYSYIYCDWLNDYAVGSLSSTSTLRIFLLVCS